MVAALSPGGQGPGRAQGQGSNFLEALPWTILIPRRIQSNGRNSWHKASISYPPEDTMRCHKNEVFGIQIIRQCHFWVGSSLIRLGLGADNCAVTQGHESQSKWQRKLEREKSPKNWVENPKSMSNPMLMVLDCGSDHYLEYTNDPMSILQKLVKKVAGAAKSFAER
ncbi:hypothetical protein K438DRAFT_1753509 [Mycena galopus ATCC 62051]|nr:hypothetical protein K438DRAFT_1753509 [Mycena galopus ATCC 62051]